MDNIKKIDPIVLRSRSHDRPFSLDVTFRPDGVPKPVILHLHGFKGFKDWGFFNQLAAEAARQGFIFIKMNFSHNGTTPEQPLVFADLEAFGLNNFSIEQNDISLVIDHLFSADFEVDREEIDKGRLFLTGHSRGGAAAILKGYHDKRVKAVASWAGVNDLANHFSSMEVEKWKKTGIIYIENSRTKQQMPLYYQIVEDYLLHEEFLNVPYAIKHFMKPLCIIHGSGDQTVPVQVAYLTQQWNSNVELHIIEGADHVFNGGHPWQGDDLPENARTMLDLSLKFFRSV